MIHNILMYVNKKLDPKPDQVHKSSRNEADIFEADIFEADIFE
jgi:hypothetical protein